MHINPFSWLEIAMVQLMILQKWEKITYLQENQANFLRPREYHIIFPSLTHYFKPAKILN